MQPSRQCWGWICSAVMFGLWMLTGCGGEGAQRQQHAGEYPYRVVASVGMVADIVREVGGDYVDVESMIGEGVDPHQHSPTRQDMRLLLDADVVFYSGLNLEGRMSETFRDLQEGGVPVFAVTDSLARERLRTPGEYEGHADPHVWMDVSMWAEAVDFVAESLSSYDPTHRDAYLENAKAYRQRLEELDDYVRTAVQSIPKAQRVLITAHDAFGYFGDAYGIEVMAPQGISTESEASVEDINELVRLIVERKVQAIFVESSVNPKSIAAILEGVEKQGHKIRIGGTLYSDAMGTAGTYEGTYIGMLDHNATVIVRALGGEAPARGWQGMLREKGE